MTPPVCFALHGQPLARIAAPLALAGFFADERPLRGAAGQADWRLCGFVTDLVAAGRIEGHPGEAVLVPTGGRLRAPRLMLLGLGERAAFRSSYFEAATTVALERTVALGLESAVMAPLGIAADALEGHAGPLVRAVSAGIEGAAAPFELTLAVDETSLARIQAALLEAIERLGVDAEVRIAATRAPAQRTANPGPPAV